MSAEDERFECEGRERYGSSSHDKLATGIEPLLHKILVLGRAVALTRKQEPRAAVSSLVDAAMEVVAAAIPFCSVNEEGVPQWPGA
jgi:hypothetical protein